MSYYGNDCMFENDDRKTLGMRITSIRLAVISFFMKIIGVDLYLKNQADILTGQMESLRSDMKLLYNEIDTNTRFSLSTFSRIKPVIKVDSPEAEAFFRSVLSTHDKSIRTQQECLETKMLTLQQLENEVKSTKSRLEQDINLQKEKYDLIIGKLRTVQDMLNEWAAKEEKTDGI